MTAKGPSRFNNQPASQGAWVSAREAIALLGIKRDTLYSYVSRGWIRRSGSRSNARYAADDLARLKARHDARAGHAVVAAAAMHWGEAVLPTAISHITEEGPCYRGISALELARHNTSFEAVARWLLDATPMDVSLARAARLLVPPEVPRASILSTLLATYAMLSTHDRAYAPDALLALAPRVIAWTFGREAPDANLSIAQSLLHALGRNPDDDRAVALVNKALVVVADHDLNASTFAARVAAGTGAAMVTCLCAGLAALSGPKHGAMSDGVEEFLARCEDEQRVRTRVTEALQRGDAIPGAGHPLYAQGDPRARYLLEESTILKPETRLFSAFRSTLEAHRVHPNVDLALVGVRFALGCEPRSSAALFAVGRLAGWMAHIREQQLSGVLLRPRARYLPSE